METRAGWQEALAQSIQVALLQGQEQVLGGVFSCGSAPLRPPQVNWFMLKRG